MCGIVGCVMKGKSGLFKKHEDSFFELLFADQLRGEDSTGIIGIEKDRTFTIAKEATKASDFIPKFKALPSVSAAMWNNGVAYIGHNRKKTVGTISDETAHPFVVDKTFAMVHNGTLERWYNLAKDCKVDSEALAHHLHASLKKSMDEGDVTTSKDFEDALGHVEGAYAMAMYDQTRHKLFLTRNKDRPLSLIETEDSYFFMSEALMGAWILSRPYRFDYSKLKVSAINEHEVITFDLEKGVMVREQLSPKKRYQSYQSSTTTTHGNTNLTHTSSGGYGTTVNRKGVQCSESNFKTFLKTFIGKRITVVVNDLLEDNYPTERLEWKNCDKINLYSNAPCLDWSHCVTFLISCKSAGVKTAEDILGKKWVVDIESAYLSTHGTIMIEGANPKPVVSNVLQLKGNETNKEFRSMLAKLDYEELHAMAEEVKYSGANWQVNCVAAEIVWRDSTSSLEEADKKAKKANVVLIQKQRNGKFIYSDSEGNVYYECAIALQ